MDKANPKDKYGLAKVPLGLVPASSIIYQALAQRDGAGKYGPFNWREKPIKVSIFYDAALRHLLAWWDREELAEDSGVPHLGHALACIGIIIDAIEFGNVIDDRPPKGSAQRVLDRFKKDATLKEQLDGAPPFRLDGWKEKPFELKKSELNRIMKGEDRACRHETYLGPVLRTLSPQIKKQFEKALQAEMKKKPKLETALWHLAYGKPKAPAKRRKKEAFRLYPFQSELHRRLHDDMQELRRKDGRV
jgi:hypothetical protein